MEPNFSLKYLFSGTKLKDLPITNIPEFVLVGRSNVGKSSLINFLSGQKKLAFVSQTPGRTQAINIFGEINDRFLIADLPGYGFSKSSHKISSEWASHIQEYFQKRKNIRAVFFLIDVRRTINDEDVSLIYWFKSLGIKVVILQTKCDKVSKNELIQQKQKQSDALSIEPKNIISISVHKKIGLKDLCNQFISLAKL